MTRRAVVSRVISTPRCLAVSVAIVEIMRATYSSRNFSESVNSFGVSVFLPRFVGIWLSNGVVKSKNKFAQPKIEWNTGSASWSRTFEKSRFSRKREDLGRFRVLNRSGVLAGANFIALRRPACIKHDS